MSFSFTKFTAKGEFKAEDNDVLKAKVGKTSYGATGTLDASLPEGLTGKIVFTDKTLVSVRLWCCTSCGPFWPILNAREPYAGEGQADLPPADRRLHRDRQAGCVSGPSCRPQSYRARRRPGSLTARWMRPGCARQAARRPADPGH